MPWPMIQFVIRSGCRAIQPYLAKPLGVPVPKSSYQPIELKALVPNSMDKPLVFSETQNQVSAVVQLVGRIENASLVRYCQA